MTSQEIEDDELGSLTTGIPMKDCASQVEYNSEIVSWEETYGGVESFSDGGRGEVLNTREGGRSGGRLRRECQHKRVKFKVEGVKFIITSAVLVLHTSVRTDVVSVRYEAELQDFQKLFSVYGTAWYLQPALFMDFSLNYLLIPITITTSTPIWELYKQPVVCPKLRWVGLRPVCRGVRGPWAGRGS